MAASRSSISATARTPPTRDRWRAPGSSPSTTPIRSCRTPPPRSTPACRPRSRPMVASPRARHAPGTPSTSIRPTLQFGHSAARARSQRALWGSGSGCQSTAGHLPGSPGPDPVLEHRHARDRGRRPASQRASRPVAADRAQGEHRRSLRPGPGLRPDRRQGHPRRLRLHLLDGLQRPEQPPATSICTPNNPAFSMPATFPATRARATAAASEPAWINGSAAARRSSSRSTAPSSDPATTPSTRSSAWPRSS